MSSRVIFGRAWRSHVPVREHLEPERQLRRVVIVEKAVAGPGVQMALVGSMATDDPEGWRIYEQIERETAGERACFLLTDLLA